ncbi:MAG: proline--tRNA ligase [Planctomycetota bacterium]|nr:proline--tRNA ligase [Planctomycetota bacterium]
MAKARQNAISPTRAEDYAEWYQQVIKAADMGESSPVRGCMVIKPWGYSFWENIQRSLDERLKASGHANAYFPLFIPKSFLEKEAEHVEGFAKECAVVTHHRLEPGPDGSLVPAGELEEPLIVRPTSETMIGAIYAKWVQSYRDLPILLNQWCNVVRWELRPRLFLRTSEFLWQEGHTAHETSEEARAETRKVLEIYRGFVEDCLALPVVVGVKTAAQRFPGAVETMCIEAMMQDRKALQAGTSHYMGQNFAKASGIVYQSREGREEHAWTTSWGASARLIGAAVMTHADDDGMVMPPRLAPAHAVILPIFRGPDERRAVLDYAEGVAAAVRRLETPWGGKIEVMLDSRDMNAGEKGWEWVKKGVPIRVEAGPRDLEKNAVFVARRDRGPRDKYSQGRDDFIASLPAVLRDIQDGLFARAKAFRDANCRDIDDLGEFKAFFTPARPEKPEIHGGFALSHWCGDPACETRVAEELAATIRCVPLDREKSGPGKCVVCGGGSEGRVPFAKAY